MTFVQGTSSIDSAAVYATGDAASSVAASVSVCVLPFTSPLQADVALQSAAAAAATSAVGAINNGAAGGAASVSGASTASAPAVTKSAVSNAAVTFTVPGRHILILPVGLVVFCVITGIMLLVIVYQHFWRMRYRSVSRPFHLAMEHNG